MRTVMLYTAPESLKLLKRYIGDIVESNQVHSLEGMREKERAKNRFISHGASSNWIVS